MAWNWAQTSESSSSSRSEVIIQYICTHSVYKLTALTCMPVYISAQRESQRDAQSLENNDPPREWTQFVTITQPQTLRIPRSRNRKDLVTVSGDWWWIFLDQRKIILNGKFRAGKFYAYGVTLHHRSINPAHVTKLNKRNLTQSPAIKVLTYMYTGGKVGIGRKLHGSRCSTFNGLRFALHLVRWLRAFLPSATLNRIQINPVYSTVLFCQSL